MSVLVVILTGETKPSDDNIQNLQWLFSDPYFEVKIIEVTPPPTITNVENYRMLKALSYAANFNIPSIIIKDSSVSNVTPLGKTSYSDEIIGGMVNRIQTALSVELADLCYLCTWNDNCPQLKDIAGIGNIDHGSTLKWTIYPNATQAILYRPIARDFIKDALENSDIPLGQMLNSYISSGKLLATTFVPNIVDFDITLATAASDYLKLNECGTGSGTSSSSSNASSIIWFLIIVAIIIFIAWSVIRLNRF